MFQRNHLLQNFGLSLLTLVATAPSGFGAFATQFIGPDGGNWAVPGNWSAGVPGANDEINLNGFNVVVDTVQAYKDFDTTATNTGGSLTINNGGELTTDGGHHGAWGLSSIVINSGGAFFNDPTTENNLARLRVSTTVNVGGLLVGFSDVQALLNVDGTFRPYNQAAANSISVSSTLNLNDGGILELDVFGNGSNELLNVSGTANLSVVGSTILLVPQGSYTPGINDSFNLIDGAGTINVLSDAGNVSMPGVVAWDTSQWASDGILTVAAVPEPSAFALIAGIMALGLLTHRRRQN